MFSLCFSRSVHLEAQQIYWSSQGQIFGSVDFSVGFFFFNLSDFGSNHISFLLLTLGTICSCFSSFLKKKLKSWIWDLSSFLIKTFNAIHYPLNTVLAAFKFLVCCHFIFIQFKILARMWSWQIFHVCWKRIYILLLLCRMFCVYQHR